MGGWDADRSHADRLIMLPLSRAAHSDRPQSHSPASAARRAARNRGTTAGLAISCGGSAAAS